MIHKPVIKRLRLVGVLTMGFALLGSLPLVANEPDTDPSAKSSSEHKLTAKEFAQQTYLGGLKEIHLATVAAQRAEKPEVREFAVLLKIDHTQANDRLAAIAKMKGIELAPTNVFAANNVVSTRSYTSGRSVSPADAPRPAEPPRSDVLKDSTTGSQPKKLNESPVDTTGGAAKENMIEKHARTIREIEAKTGVEFDQAFVSQMLKDHTKNVTKFETVSRDLDDAELKQFAAETLPTLRRHQARAAELGTLLGLSSLAEGQASSRQ